MLEIEKIIKILLNRISIIYIVVMSNIVIRDLTRPIILLVFIIITILLTV